MRRSSVSRRPDRRGAGRTASSRSTTWSRHAGAGRRSRCPRLWVDRVFAAKGSGTVVTGTLVGGSLTSRSRSWSNRAPAGAGAGDRRPPDRRVDRSGRAIVSRVNLAGVDHGDLRPGPRPGRTRPLAADRSIRCIPPRARRRSATTCPVVVRIAAYIGSGEHPVKLRVLGGEALAPGSDGYGSVSSARSRSRCCPAIVSSSVSPAATRPSAAARCSTSIP